jgi:hypothetical protein
VLLEHGMMFIRKDGPGSFGGEKRENAEREHYG